MHVFKCALCRVNNERRPVNDKNKAKKDIRFYNRHRREWFESVVNEIKNDPVHPTCFSWMIKNINRLNKINKTKNEKWEYITIPQNPQLALTRCALCRFFQLRVPKRNKLKKEKDHNFQRRDPRGYFKTIMKDVKNKPLHYRCFYRMVKDMNDLNDLNKDEDCEKIPFPQNSVLDYNEDSDDHWTDVDDEVRW